MQYILNTNFVNNNIDGYEYQYIDIEGIQLVIFWINRVAIIKSIHLLNKDNSEVDI